MRGPHRTAAVAIPKNYRIIGWVIRDAVPRVDLKVTTVLVDQVDPDVLISPRSAGICLVELPDRQIGCIGTGDGSRFDVKVVISINSGGALVSGRVARYPDLLPRIFSTISYIPQRV